VVDFEIQRFSRRCCVTDRELQPGERFFSVLVPEGDKVVRRDFSVEAWAGPPEDAVGHWRSEVPDPRANRMKWAPHEIMLQLFRELLENTTQRDFLYVLTLLLIRRRLFKLEATEADSDGGEVLLVFCSRHECEYRVGVATPDQRRADEIQQELASILFAGAEDVSPQEGRGRRSTN
jgi:hypothetical protein